MNFDELQVSLPEPKRMKAKYLLAEATLQRGCRTIPLKLLRELAGSAQYWSVVCPELRPYLPILYSLMHVPSGGEGKWATPRPNEDPDRLWEEFWDALDFIRLQLERPVAASFNASFEKLLPIRELLALPGVAQRTRIVGGDATLSRFGAVDWKAKRFMVAETAIFIAAIRSSLTEADQVEIIASMELLTFVVFATEEGNAWSKEVIFYVTDNQNVQSWLAKRRPKSRAARRLILLLHRLEVECHVRCVPVYIRTYRNQLADWLSREELAKVRSDLEAEGWVEVEFSGEQLVEDARFGPLVLSGEKGATAQLARQLAVSNLPRALPRLVWIRSDWEVVLHGPKEVSSAVQALVRHGHEISQAGRFLWSSLSQDPSGSELARALLALDAALREGRLVSVVLDVPRHLDPSLILEEFRCRGLNCSSTPYRTSDFGVPTARRRHCISGAKPPFSPDLEALGRLQVPTPPSLKLVPFNVNP